MKLSDFVSETLVQIVSGITDAQEKTSELGGKVSPVLTGSVAHGSQHGFLQTVGKPAQMVEFDVALTVTEGTGTKGGIGVFAGAINLGSSGQSTNENTSISRVKFKIPLTLPS